MDLKNYLMNSNTTTTKQVKNKKQMKGKKKNEMSEDINIVFNPNKNISIIIDLLNKESTNLDKYHWNKLEKGIKYDKILEYITDLKIKFKLNEEIYEQNKKFILQELKKNKLNKLSDIEYNEVEGKIIKLNNINFNETILLFEYN
tara:strand:+ start:1511 stop:1945 length:435 start_codon:yes stop_codon:yes gene_type:complete